MTDTDSDTDTIEQLHSRIDDLEQTVDRQQAIIDDLRTTTSRRDLLKGAATGITGVGLGALATGGASAGSSSVGTIGDQNNPIDLYTEDLYDHNNNQPLSLPGDGTTDITTLDAATIRNDDYHEKAVTQSGSTGDLDLSASNLIKQTVTGNITFSFNNVSSSPAGNSFLLIVEQDTTGGHTLSWPSAVEWAGGSAPGVSTNADDTHVFSFVSPDGGSTWYGFLAGEAMA